MKKSFVPDAMNVSPTAYRNSDAGRRNAGWISTSSAIDGRLSLGEFLSQRWLPTVELSLEPTSFVSAEGVVRNHIVPAIGQISLEDLTRELLRDFYAHLQRTTNNRGQLPRTSTVIRTHLILHRALECLVEAGVLQVNPARGARPRWKKSDRFEATIWTPDELSTFLNSVREDRLFALWRLLAFTGLRRGEALGVRWEDLSLRRGTLAVRRALMKVEGKTYFTTPKSSQARVVEIDRETARALRSHRTRMNTENLLREEAPMNAHSMAFTDPKGGLLDPNYASRHFRSLVARSCQPIIRLHDLRHTHASHLLEAGASIKAVQERLGHADVVVTLNIYSHLLPTSQKNAVDQLERFYQLGEEWDDQ